MKRNNDWASLMTTSTPIAESKLFRVVGIRMPSAAQQQAAQQAMIAHLHHATRNGEMDWTQLNVPSNPVSAVYEDDTGARFIGLSTPYGPQMIEYDNAPEFDPMSNTSDGGFLALDRLNSMSSNQDAAQPMMMSTLTTDAAKSLMSKPKSDGGPSIAESILKSMAMGMGLKAVGNVLVGLASGEDNDKLIDNFVASTTTADGLTKLGASLASGLISNVIGMGVSAAMSKWEVDDESSTAEHAAKKAAKALVDKLQSELMSLIDEQIANVLGTAGPAQAPVPPGTSPKSLMDKIAEFFTGPTSTASVPVGCIGCGNTNDGILLTGGPTVMVGGLPVSRLSDKVTMTKPIPDIGPLISGNPTVLSLSLPTAGDGHVAVGGKGVVTLLQNCVASVLMGPQGMPVVTPTPKENGPGRAMSNKAEPNSSAKNRGKANSKSPSHNKTPIGGKEKRISTPAEISSALPRSSESTGSTATSSSGKSEYKNTTGVPEADLKDQYNSTLGVPSSPTGCVDDQTIDDGYACSWWHCTNNCEMTRELGSDIAHGLSNVNEVLQYLAARAGADGLRQSGLQCSDYADNAVGRAIAQDSRYNAYSCEAACANELGNGDISNGYMTFNLPEVPGGTRPPGPAHPNGSTTGCNPSYYSYDHDPTTGGVRPKPNLPAIPSPSVDFSNGADGQIESVGLPFIPFL